MKHVSFEWEAHVDSVCRLDENDKTTNGRGTIGHRGHLLDMFSLDACKFACMQEIDCTGIEFHPDGSGSHCEVWSKNIGHVSRRPGYTCQILKKRPARLSFASKALIKDQPAVAEVPRGAWSDVRMATVAGTAAVAVLALAVAVVPRVARSICRMNHGSDSEAEGTLLA